MPLSSSLSWSATVSASVRALSLAREAESLLVRDARNNLSLFNPRGELQGRCTFQDLASSCLADDNSALAAAAGERVCWLEQDLSIRWEKKIAAAGTAVALDSFGQYLVVADKKGELLLFDRVGRLLGQFQSPRPVQHLTFVTELPLLMAAADFGWVGCLNLSSGEWAWSDRPVSQIGSLAVAGSGGSMLLACFNVELRGHEIGSGNRFSITLPKPCGLVALTFAGNNGVAAGPGKECFGFNRQGDLTFTQTFDHSPTALALSALGDRVICGFADGRVLAQKWEG